MISCPLLLESPTKYTISDMFNSKKRTCRRSEVAVNRSVCVSIPVHNQQGSLQRKQPLGRESIAYVRIIAAASFILREVLVPIFLNCLLCNIFSMAVTLKLPSLNEEKRFLTLIAPSHSSRPETRAPLIFFTGTGSRDSKFKYFYRSE
jgi:hypothetical protein